MEPRLTPSHDIMSPSRVAQQWWDTNAEAYLSDSPGIGRTRFQWCPEGWTEDDLCLLDPEGTILEVGAGSAPCGRYLASRGRHVISTDISSAMVAAALEINREEGIDFEVRVGDILDLPYEAVRFDIAFTSFGAIGFIPDLKAAFTEIARVLRPGGQWVYAATHPMSWVFPDSPHVDDLQVIRSYGQSDAYVEASGETIEYAEFSHTFSDHMNGLIAAGFTIEQVIEPMWKPGHTLTWGPWAPERGAFLPGSLIISARLPAR